MSLRSLRVSLDGKDLGVKTPSGDTDPATPLFTGPLTAGTHTLVVEASMEGSASIFTYMDGYRLKLKNVVNLEVLPGEGVAIRSRVVPKTGLTVPWQERNRLVLTLTPAKVRPEPSAVAAATAAPEPLQAAAAPSAPPASQPGAIPAAEPAPSSKPEPSPITAAEPAPTAAAEPAPTAAPVRMARAPEPASSPKPEPALAAAEPAPAAAPSSPAKSASEPPPDKAAPVRTARPFRSTETASATLVPAPVARPTPAASPRPTAGPCALEPVRFGFDSSALPAEARPSLDRYAACLATTTSTIRLEGQSDPRGSVEYNRWLAWDRAAAVRAYLQEQGVPGRRLLARVSGTVDPGCPEGSEDCFAALRRVDAIPRD